MMKPFIVEESNDISEAKILVVGIGNSGCNIIEHITRECTFEVETLVMYTDREFVLENYEDIRVALEGFDIVFICTGLGGGTSSEASPVIARIAKEVGSLTIPVVTKPFKFEGNKRSMVAEKDLKKLKKDSSSLILISNDKLLSVIDKKLNIKDSFKIIDAVMAQAVSGILGIVLSSGDNDINLDFADLLTIMRHRGISEIGFSSYEGNNAAYKAMHGAITFPTLDNTSIKNAMGILVHFKIHPDFLIMEISEAMDIIHEIAHEDAEIIFGTSTDKTLGKEYVEITIIVTGFERNNQKFKISNNTNYDG